jgi:hypothetical protein
VDRSKLIKSAYIIFEVQKIKLVFVVFTNASTGEESNYWIPYSIFKSINQVKINSSLCDFETKARSTFPPAPSDITDPKIYEKAELALTIITKAMINKVLSAA